MQENWDESIIRGNPYYIFILTGEYKMDYQIVNDYMTATYPNMAYSTRKGNDCIWVSMGLVNMYFIIRDNKIADIQVD
jgi:hypothetical protein